MPDRIFTILLVQNEDEDTTSLCEALRRHAAAEAQSVRCVADHAEATRHIAAGDIDLVLLDIGTGDQPALAMIEQIRTQSPSLPVVVITGAGDEELAVAALRAGAQDCLVRGDALQSVLGRAVRHAVERTAFQTRIDEARDQDVRDREFGELQAIYGPPPLPVTERSFGVKALLEKAPEDFSVLIVAYAEMLDLAFDRRQQGEAEGFDQRLSRIADRLGVLNAGPRDVIELHKAAVGGRLKGQSPGRARAYVEEGRLVMLQVMGHLVAYYRTLSWGRGSDRRWRKPENEALTKPGAREGNP